MAKKKTYKIHSQLNYISDPNLREKRKGESQTIPGEAYTIKELLEKFASGIPLPDQSVYYDEKPTFETDTTLRDPDRDLSNLDDYIDQVIRNEQKRSSERKKEAEKPEKLADEETKGSSAADDEGTKTTIEGKEDS